MPSLFVIEFFGILADALFHSHLQWCNDAPIVNVYFGVLPKDTNLDGESNLQDFHEWDCCDIHYVTYFHKLKKSRNVQH